MQFNTCFLLLLLLSLSPSQLRDKCENMRRIKSSVYDDYNLVLAGDLTGIGHENVNLDHHHAIVKRLGLAQVPLCVVMVRFLLEAAKYSATFSLLNR